MAKPTRLKIRTSSGAPEPSRPAGGQNQPASSGSSIRTGQDLIREYTTADMPSEMSANQPSQFDAQAQTPPSPPSSHTRFGGDSAPQNTAGSHVRTEAPGGSHIRTETMQNEGAHLRNASGETPYRMPENPASGGQSTPAVQPQTRTPSTHARFAGQTEQASAHVRTQAPTRMTQNRDLQHLQQKQMQHGSSSAHFRQVNGNSTRLRIGGKTPELQNGRLRTGKTAADSTLHTEQGINVNGKLQGQPMQTDALAGKQGLLQGKGTAAGQIKSPLTAKETLRMNTKSKAMLSKTGGKGLGKLSQGGVGKTRVSMNGMHAKSKLHMPGTKRLNIKGLNPTGKTAGMRMNFGGKGAMPMGKGGSFFSRIGDSVRQIGSKIGSAVQTGGKMSLPWVMAGTVAVGSYALAEMQNLNDIRGQAPAMGYYTYVGQLPDNELWTSIRESVFSGSPYTDPEHPDGSKTLASQYILDELSKAQETRETEPTEEQRENMTPIKITWDGATMMSSVLPNNDYMAFRPEIAFLGTPDDPSSAPIVHIEEPEFQDIPELSRRTGSMTLKYHIGYSTYTQICFRTLDNGVKQYLGNFDHHNITRANQNLVGWAFRQDAATPVFGRYQEITPILYQRLAELNTDQGVDLYPVWSSDKNEVSIEPVSVVSDDEIKEALRNHFSPADLSIQYAYLNADGNTEYSGSDPTGQEDISPYEIYKTILAMTTVALCNDENFGLHGDDYVKYAKHLLELSFDSAGGFAVDYTTRWFSDADSHLQHHFRKNGVAYSGADARLTCQVTIYLTPSAEELMEHDTWTGADIYQDTVQEQPDGSWVYGGPYICPFQGWDAINKEAVAEYLRYDDVDFRSMFNVVFPSLTSYMTGNGPAAVLFNAMKRENFSTAAALAVLANLYMETDGLNQRFEQVEADGIRYVGIAHLPIDELNAYASAFGESWVPGEGGVSVENQVRCFLQNLPNKWVTDTEANSFLNTYNLEEFAKSPIMSLNDFKDITSSTLGFLSVRACYLHKEYNEREYDTGKDVLERFRKDVKYGNSNGDITGMVMEAVKLAGDKSHGFSNVNRNGPDYDGASFVAAVLKEKGLDLPEWGGTLPGASYLYSSLLQSHKWDAIDYTDTSDLMRGDILFHNPGESEIVAIYTTGGKIVGAFADHDGKPGDSSGNEITETTLGFTPRAVLRYNGTPGAEFGDSGEFVRYHGAFLWPLPQPYDTNFISSGYGYRGPMSVGTSWHAGLDIHTAGTIGVPIYAVMDGVVLLSSDGYNGGCGNYTVIDHKNGLYTEYMHQNSRAVSPGDTVKKGQVIGYVGTTGDSTGPHLHLGVIVSDHGFDTSCRVYPGTFLGIGSDWDYTR